MSRILTLMLCALTVGLSAYAAPKVETLQITTYYPSPYGVYKILQVVPSDMSTTALPSTECDGAEDRGKIMYSDGGQALMACLYYDSGSDGVPDTYGWQAIVAGDINSRIDARQIFSYGSSGKITVNPLRTDIGSTAIVDFGNRNVQFSTGATNSASDVAVNLSTGLPYCKSSASTPFKDVDGAWKCPVGGGATISFGQQVQVQVPGGQTGLTRPANMFGIGTGAPSTNLDIYGQRPAGKQSIMLNGKSLIKVRRYTYLQTKAVSTSVNKIEARYNTGISGDDYFCTAGSSMYRYTVDDNIVNGVAAPTNPDVRATQSSWTYMTGSSGRLVWNVYVSYPVDVRSPASEPGTYGYPAVDVVCYQRDIIDYGTANPSAQTGGLARGSDYVTDVPNP